MHELRLANLLGACGLAVADRVRDVTAGLNPSSAAAVVVLAAGPVGGTELGRRVGLTQSAATRLVDSLVAAGLAARSSRAGRSVLVSLTESGRWVADELLAARAEALAGVLSVLPDDERARLGGLLEKLLARLYDDIGSAELMCRLCDRSACTSGAVCPVGQAERDRGRG
ncbi:MarR family winged helix-turn-helix transcriptional regulator [Actinophytocola glycyrrhizae]|uniref:MarR family winged helix-turn-helix transcriptional regulator n=1 Tax=Actinophytocola glycyrrhizae TaxID=2044873 RepID=A0ABV9S305_9PSEU